jgi:hypothetical protein
MVDSVQNKGQNNALGYGIVGAGLGALSYPALKKWGTPHLTNEGKPKDKWIGSVSDQIVGQRVEEKLGDFKTLKNIAETGKIEGVVVDSEIDKALKAAVEGVEESKKTDKIKEAAKKLFTEKAADEKYKFTVDSEFNNAQTFIDEQTKLIKVETFDNLTTVNNKIKDVKVDELFKDAGTDKVKQIEVVKNNQELFDIKPQEITGKDGKKEMQTLEKAIEEYVGDGSKVETMKKDAKGFQKRIADSLEASKKAATDAISENYNLDKKAMNDLADGAKKSKAYEAVEAGMKEIKGKFAKKWALIGAAVLAALGLIAGFATRKPAVPADEAPQS